MLSPKLHGWLDYVTVIFFAIAPSIFALSETAVTISYILAVVHLLMTVSTKLPAGMVELIPFKLHGYVELAVSIVLVIGPWVLADIFTYTDQLFFTICGAVIFIVWIATAYENPENNRR